MTLLHNSKNNSTKRCKFQRRNSRHFPSLCFLSIQLLQAKQRAGRRHCSPTVTCSQAWGGGNQQLLSSTALQYETGSKDNDAQLKPSPQWNYLVWNLAQAAYFAPRLFAKALLLMFLLIHLITSGKKSKFQTSRSCRCTTE